MAKNTLYYGDNLEILRDYVKDESVDLVYLDPPFNSNATYNVLFAEKNGTKSAAQIQAFEDTWHWDNTAAAACEEVIESGGQPAKAMIAFKELLGTSDMMAYLAMMAPRLIEMRRVLKHTGSIFLHCDPTASHYLKILLDSIFDPCNFKNEIVWQRTASKSHMKIRYPSNHDIILFFQKSPKATWNLNEIFIPYDPENLDEKTLSKYCHHDDRGRAYQLDNLINPNPNRPNLTYEFLGIKKVWRWTRERMQKEYERGRVVQPSSGSVPRYKRYLDEQRGRPVCDVWSDISPLNSQAKERLGYPTQKPESLLERMIKASTNKGDVVLDPFCGCGTTIAVAEKLKRRWIGIDITHLAVSLMKHRLWDTFHKKASFEVVGEPVSLADAKALAEQDRFQFQWWALGLVGARPTDQKKGADHGIDGRLYFHDDNNGKTKQVILSVKSGKVSVRDVRDLRAVVEREKAQIGVLITLNDSTGPMRKEATTLGFYESPWGKHPRLQILTIEQLLDDKGIDYPRVTNVTLKKAPRHRQTQPTEQAEIDLDA